MAKRQCDPTSGSIGLQVYVPGRNGQVVRIRAIPANPKTNEQVDVRTRLALWSAAWRALTENERLAWSAAALTHNSRSRLGQSGPLTGEQLYVRINVNLTMVGESDVTVPPEAPTFEANVVQTLELLNPGGVLSIKLICTGTSTAFNLVSACPPLSQGRGRPYGMNQLGLLPTVTGGKATITTLYSTKFGAPAVGQKLFVRSHQILDGWADGGKLVSGIVPVAA